MALNPPFFSLWHHRRLICFIKQRRKGENSNLWKGFANQKRIWKCWQMVVSPDVRRRCWLESVSSVSLQIFSLLKYNFFNSQCTFKWFYCTFSIGQYSSYSKTLCLTFLRWQTDSGIICNVIKLKRTTNGHKWREIPEKKADFFLRKGVFFSRVSLFIYSRLSYVTALASFK